MFSPQVGVFGWTFDARIQASRFRYQEFENGDLYFSKISLAFSRNHDSDAKKTHWWFYFWQVLFNWEAFHWVQDRRIEPSSYREKKILGFSKIKNQHYKILRIWEKSFPRSIC